MSSTAISTARRIAPRRLMGALTDNTTVLVASLLTSNALRFASNLILTRLLVPEAFGIMLIIGSVNYSLSLLSETGVSPYLIRTRGAAGRRTLDFLWTVQVARGVLLFCVLLAAAPFIADALGKPEATDPLRVASLVLLLAGFKSLRPMVVRREGRERRNAVIELGVYLVFLPILIGLAVLLRSYWALVIGVVIQAALATAASYVLYEGSGHSLRWSGPQFASLWRFTRFILASSIITAIVMQFDKIFVAGTVSLREAGLYAMAWNLAIVGDSLSNAYFSRVYFPAASTQLRRERPGPRSYYVPMRVVRPLIVFACAAGVTFGERFFAIAFDDDYLMSGVYFTVLAFKPMLSVICYCTGNYLTAAGVTWPHLISNFMRVAWLPAGAVIGYHQFGIFGLLWAVALVDLLPSIFQYVIVARLGVVRVKDELPTIVAVPAGLLVGLLCTWATQWAV